MRTMAAMDDPILQDVLELDETTIVEHEPGKQGCSHGKRLKFKWLLKCNFRNILVKF